MTTPAARSRSIAISIARAAIDGIGRSQGERGIDVGAAAEPVMEDLPKVSDTGYEALPGPRGVADDLKKLPGISGSIEKQLNDLGIFHYWQLAPLAHEQAHRLGEEVGLPGPCRSVGRQGQGIHGRSRVTLVEANGAGPDPRRKVLFRNICHGRNHRSAREGSARTDRRGHDGLQVGADRDQGRHRSGDRLAAQEGPVEGRQERPTASRPKA